MIPKLDAGLTRGREVTASDAQRFSSLLEYLGYGDDTVGWWVTVPCYDAIPYAPRTLTGEYSCFHLNKSAQVSVCARQLVNEWVE
ncbi:unnamed protein product [Haemonchus placei]|uniref:Carn_acyltransf domain-containing protein n=1 Tax=Haemonchus placei TaxID=6290 RepID=A0A0N4VXT3_HAEPC|nr:unnamed protein product [Haemonchus placei]